MVVKVSVPMDFGRHLLDSPTHGNLKLNTSERGEVRASSVILSFNSPVIDHMTSYLHMNCVDMLEFCEAAVQLFVDAAYSGTAEGITRGTFRDINKIANVFEMTWLAEKCAEYFTEVAESVKTPSYTELLYIFEEAGFVFENLNTKDFLNVAIRRIEMLRWKQQFIDKYLENADRLSTRKLDMIIELAGTEVNCVVQILTNQLSELLKVQGSSLPVSCEYLLDNTNLYFCYESDRVLFNQLFDVLRGLPDEKMRWTLDLYRKSIEDPSALTHSTVVSAPEASGFKLSGELCIKGHHGNFIVATSNMGAKCNSKHLGAIIQVVEIKTDHVALKSTFGKYLSAQKNHSLQWNRNAAQGWEHFKVGWIDQNKFTLKSFHGRYLSAQPNGNLDCNRDKALAWEHFTIVKPSAQPYPSGGVSTP